MLTSVEDRFTGANGTALAAHTPNIGGPWVDFTPGLQLAGNKLTGTNATALSEIRLPGKTVTVHFDFEPNGMAAPTFFSVEIGNFVAPTNFVHLSILASGIVNVEVSKAGAPTENTTGTVFGYLGTGLNRFKFGINASEVFAFLNGRRIWAAPRALPKTMLVDWLDLRIDRVAGTFPLIDNLVVTR